MTQTEPRLATSIPVLVHIHPGNPGRKQALPWTPQEQEKRGRQAQKIRQNLEWA